MVHGSKPEDVLKDEEGVQIMKELGRNMAWLLKSIDAGKQAGVTQPSAIQGEGERGRGTEANGGGGPQPDEEPILRT